MGSPAGGGDGTVYGGCAHFSANGLGILNTTSQPTVSPHSHVASSPRTDSVGTIAVCSWPVAV